MDPQALARRSVAAARNVFRSTAHRPNRESPLRTIWKRVLDASERAGARIVRMVVDQVFGRSTCGTVEGIASRDRHAAQSSQKTAKDGVRKARSRHGWPSCWNKDRQKYD